MSSERMHPAALSYEKALAEHRRILVDRVNEFCRLTGMAKTTLAIKVGCGDASLFWSIEKHQRNLRPKTYDRIMRWLDANWPKKKRMKRAA